jgi:hypothetical protein
MPYILVLKYRRFDTLYMGPVLRLHNTTTLQYATPYILVLKYRRFGTLFRSPVLRLHKHYNTAVRDAVSKQPAPSIFMGHYVVLQRR